LKTPNSEIEIPGPDDVHYAAHVNQTSQTIKVAADYWLHQAHGAMLYELAEEIGAGQIKVNSDWWRAQIHRRALEMIEADDDLRPSYKTKLHQTIENEALYHHAGYASAEEWFMSESSLKRGGMRYELRWIASTLIPWCKSKNIFRSTETADNWFFTPKNKGGESRMRRMRDALPELRRVIENNFGEQELTPQEQRLIVSNMLKEVSGDISDQKLKEDFVSIRGVKPVIRLHKNGDGRWHGHLELDDYQLERFKLQNEFTTVIIIESALRADDDQWYLEGYDWLNA
jgi:hypothetical protein